MNKLTFEELGEGIRTVIEKMEKEGLNVDTPDAEEQADLGFDAAGRFIEDPGGTVRKLKAMGLPVEMCVGLVCGVVATCSALEKRKDSDG